MTVVSKNGLSWDRSWLLALALTVVTFVAYQPVWHAGFIWDDDDHLTANPAMTAAHGLRMIWSSLAVSRYYPLTLTSFWVQRRLWGLNPLPYHWVNIALHAANGILIFLVLRRLQVRAAWWVAVLWVLHPVNVESVAWVTELKNTQSGVFFFCALLCFLRFEAQGRRRWYAWALLCGVAAVLSKPSTVVLPLVLLLCVWWERGGWRRADIVRTIPFFALALLMSALTIAEQRRSIVRQGTAEWSLGIAERLIIAGKGIWFYLGKVLWPANLVFVYPRWEATASPAWSWVPLAGVMAGGFVLWAWRRQPWARAGLFGLGFFVVALLPVLGFVDVYYFRYSFVADHFQYLASLGIVACAAGWMARISGGSRLWLTPIGNAVCAALVVTLAGVTWRRAHIYRNVETLWRDTVTKNPSAWIAHNNLGTALQDMGKVSEAQEHYEQALRLKPDYAEAHNNLGTVFLHFGKVTEAIGQYEQALRIRPDYVKAHANLGNALLRLGKVSEAEGQYEQALRIRPDSAEVHFALGGILERLGRMPEAVAHYEQALRSEPDFAEAHYDLGIVLWREGKVPEAISHFEQALHFRPDYAEAHNDLGVALVERDKIEEAVGHYGQALRLKPDYAEAHANLGNALLRLGKASEAREHYEQALKLKPDYAEAHNSLGVVLWQEGRSEEAIEHFERALRIKPDYAEAHYNLGVTLEQGGKVSEAKEHYAQALKLKPDYTKAQNGLARLRAVQ